MLTGDIMIILNDIKYNLVENYKDSFDLEQTQNLATDYFNDFDYIVGDWSYGKLRLKGFCKKDNPNFKAINDIANKEEYIKKQCAYNCGYFVLEKSN